MALYTQLLTFLMEKAKHINNLYYKPGFCNNVYASEISKLFDLFEDEIKSTRIRQVQINELLTVLLDLSYIKKNYANSDIKTIDDQVSKYLEKYIVSILNNKEEFGNYHPLFGFQVFHNMLRSAWLETESYEQLARLEKLTNANNFQ